MLRVFEGVIARRLLLNFRVDPAVARAIVPEPLTPRLVGGAALGGVSLIRLEHLRPRGLKPLPGLAIENMVHRIAVNAPGEAGGEVSGVYVLRRHTESRLVALLGSPLFAGEHRLARFDVEEDERKLRLEVRTEDGSADVAAEIDWGASFQPSASFPTLAGAQRFFQECELGFTAGRPERVLETVQLRPIPARLEPVRLRQVRARFFENDKIFPDCSVTVDAAFAMRSLPYEWVVVREQPEVLEEPLLPQPA